MNKLLNGTTVEPLLTDVMGADNILDNQHGC